MSKFVIHNLETAPQASRPLLARSQEAFKMIPNLHGVMAEAPGLLEGYQKLHKLATETSFTKTELTVVWQSLNVEHQCHYCVPAHTAIAHQMKVDPEVIEALRNKTPLQDQKLETLRLFTLEVARERGIVSPTSVETFLASGFTRRQLLEVILILSQKIMSNYTNHLADTPLDKPFQKFDWSPKGDQAVLS